MSRVKVTSSVAAACAAAGDGSATSAATAVVSNTCQANVRRRLRVVVICGLLRANAVSGRSRTPILGASRRNRNGDRVGRGYHRDPDRTGGGIDNLDLDALGEVAASLNRYEFLLTAAPLPTSGTGSPINPIATF